MIAHLFPLKEEKKCNCEKEKTGLQSFAERKNCEVFKAHAVKKKKSFFQRPVPSKDLWKNYTEVSISSPHSEKA